MKTKPKIEISPEVLAIIAEIDEFRGSWTYFRGLSTEKLSQLKRLASIESIGSSTRIEGSKLTDAQIEALLSGLDIRLFKTRDEQEVAGYADTQDAIFDSYTEINLSENHIKQLHRDLLKYSSKDERHRGEYKKFPNHVEAFDGEGNSIGVIFETSPPFDTPGEMQALISWTSKQLTQGELHSLLVIGVFVVNFLAIHPFQDGNGRLSRVLTNLLLLKCGYSYVPYSSLEKVVEDNKENYYKALRASQKKLGTDNEDLKPWVLFFLRSLKAQKDALKYKLEQQKLSASLPPVSNKILELGKIEPKLTIRAIVRATSENRNTIKAHIKRLVKEGYLEQHGVGKGTYYKLKGATL